MKQAIVSDEDTRWILEGLLSPDDSRMPIFTQQLAELASHIIVSHGWRPKTFSKPRHDPEGLILKRRERNRPGKLGERQKARQYARFAFRSGKGGLRVALQLRTEIFDGLTGVWSDLRDDPYDAPPDSIWGPFVKMYQRFFIVVSVFVDTLKPGELNERKWKALQEFLKGKDELGPSGERIRKQVRQWRRGLAKMFEREER